jgi:hypothetical protein
MRNNRRLSDIRYQQHTAQRAFQIHAENRARILRERAEMAARWRHAERTAHSRLVPYAGKPKPGHPVPNHNNIINRNKAKQGTSRARQAEARLGGDPEKGMGMT